MENPCEQLEVSGPTEDPDEIPLLQYIRENGASSEDELEL
jgi:hypothetical protein